MYVLHNTYIDIDLCMSVRVDWPIIGSFIIHMYVQGETYKVDRSKRKHCMRSERAVAITLVVRRVSRQRACAQPCLQAGYCLSDVCVRLALSTLFVSPCTYIPMVCMTHKYV
jgi:hypothetical protein